MSLIIPSQYSSKLHLAFEWLPNADSLRLTSYLNGTKGILESQTSTHNINFYLPTSDFSRIMASIIIKALATHKKLTSLPLKGDTSDLVLIWDLENLPINYTLDSSSTATQFKANVSTLLSSFINTLNLDTSVVADEFSSIFVDDGFLSAYSSIFSFETLAQLLEKTAPNSKVSKLGFSAYSNYFELFSSSNATSTLKKIDKKFMGAAQQALNNQMGCCNKTKGFCVDFQAAEVKINPITEDVVVKNMSDMLKTAKQICMWEHVIEKMGKERCSDTLETIKDQCFKVKMEDISILDFSPKTEPKGDYTTYLIDFKCPDVPTPDCTVY